MTSRQWSRVAAIVQSALMRDEPARTVFVAEACGDDTNLRREVDSLLARESEVDDFLNGAAADLMATADRGLMVGDRIGPYAIECRLGAGGMGEVYRARDGKLDRDVAIKILPQAISADATRVARFEREARILATLNHPRIGAIYGVEYLDGVPALILELVDGPTLAERLHGASLPVSEAVAVAIGIAEALEAAHTRGIVHRDIKPANIKFTGSSIKVLDFGLAKDVRGHEDDLSTAGTTGAHADHDLSTPGSLIGTVAYMSPEQSRGEALDARTDLFSLGAVLYEMATGRQPFVGPDASSIIKAIVHEPLPSPRAVNASIPRALERVILGLLERRRESRYQTASEVRAALANVAAGLDASSPTLSRQTRRLPLVVGVIATAAALLGASIWFRLPNRAPTRGEYTQVTHFADSATSPALSPDGRLLAFVRGSSTFEGPGQIYLKELPGGEAVQLTSDRFGKMGPIFSPDGSRIAYTSVTDGFAWDTWIVPVSSRAPQLWLRNASGLTWIGDRDVLFSELAVGLHMHVVAANDRREAVRVVYDPEGEQGMAHRSYRSPDGAWMLIVEMVRPVWQRCRLVAMDGRTNRRVGPEGQCTSAAWSPDGRWMYFSSNSSGSFHIWRQRFPDGAPEQISFGPGEEEGIAIAPDGQSLLTSVGNRQSSIWVRDASGEREVSKEGYAFIPAIPNSGVSQPFAINGRLLYLVRQGAMRFAGPDGDRAGELWQTDLETSHSEALFPGVRVGGYDVSRDGTQIAFAAFDDRGASHIWVSGTDRRTAPRQLSAREADSPHFGSGHSIYYRSSESGASLVYRMRADGDTTQALARPVAFFMSVSPDDAWLVARVEGAPGASQENIAFPTTPGRLPVRLCGGATCEVDWTPDGKSLVVRLGTTGATVAGRTFVISLRSGETLPQLPLRGIASEADLVGMRISQVTEGAVYPAHSAPLVAFVRSTTERNIYRIAVP